MKTIVCVCALLSMSAPAMSSSLMQQAAPVTKNAAFRPDYDVSKEVELAGTVRGISVRSKAGRPSGAYLTISTSRGLVDTHLGSFALRGGQPVSVYPGEQVTVVGVMSTVNSSSIFLARTVRTNTKTFIIRNEHGALLFPRPAAPGQVRFKRVIRRGVQQ
jgi:hypothetical protein